MKQMKMRWTKRNKTEHLGSSQCALIDKSCSGTGENTGDILDGAKVSVWIWPWTLMQILVRNRERLRFCFAVRSDGLNNPFDTQPECVCGRVCVCVLRLCLLPLQTPLLETTEAAPRLHSPLRISQSFTSLKADTPFTLPRWLGSGSVRPHSKLSLNWVASGDRG